MVLLAFFILFLVLWAVAYATLPAVRSLGRAMSRLLARWTRVGGFVTRTRERYKGYLAVAAVIIVGALLTAWAGDLFLDLAELVHTKSTLLQQTDARVHGWAISRRGGFSTAFFVALTMIGGPVGVGVICGVVAIVLAVKRRWLWLVYLVITAGGGGLLNMALKQYFARSRPDVAEMLRRAHGYSFPSGHAMGSAVAFGALAYLVSRSARSWAAKSAAVAAAITLVCGVALSRVYLGVHWISDVAAGACIGFVWVIVTTAGYEVLRRVRGLRSLRAR